MKTATIPASRFGWQGQTLEFMVKADGAQQIEAPAETAGMRVEVVDSKQVGDGIVARVAVHVVDSSYY